MPRRKQDGEAARGGASDSLQDSAPLGLLHHDGTPITLEDCSALYREACSENVARAAQMRALERSEDPDSLEYQELVYAARIGNARARAWGALEELARL